MEKKANDELIRALNLAVDIDSFSEEYDPYEYGDRVDNRENEIERLLNDIINGNTQGIKNFLNDIINNEDENDIYHYHATAAELINRIILFEELNFHIDTAELENRYTEAMELAGYEKIEVDDLFGIYTVAFQNKDSGEVVRTDGWAELGDKLENLMPLSENDTEKFEQLLHPEGRIMFYTKNLGGTGTDEDAKVKLYPDAETALTAYLNAFADGKEMGFFINGKQRLLCFFDSVDMKNHMESLYNGKLLNDLTVNEINRLHDSVYPSLRNALERDNVYHTIYEGFNEIRIRANVDIINTGTEWGSWIGRVANVHRPQDYVDIDITGYKVHHEIICNVNVIHANEIVDMESFTIKTDPENFTASVNEGFAQAVKELNSFFVSSVDKLDTDIEYPMEIYLPHYENNLEKHYQKLEDAGYDAFPLMRKNFSEMNLREMKQYVKNFYRNFDESIVCTNRWSDILARTVCQIVKEQQLDNGTQFIESLLKKESTLKFIAEREPNVEEIPETVFRDVVKYFEHHLPHIDPISICRISNHPEDSHLYAVIGKQKNGNYACWTSWDQNKESMNYGHYDLAFKEVAFAIINEKFNDITDELEKFGPEKTLCDISSEIKEQVKNSSKDMENGTIIPFRNKQRGR